MNGYSTLAPPPIKRRLRHLGATWKKPNRKEGEDAFLISRDQQFISLEMSETVQNEFLYKKKRPKKGL